MNNSPIGILDSGIGGVSVWKEIIKLLPQESTIYFADSKRCPYGSKTQDEVYEFSKVAIKFLLDKKCKVIVIACNTISVSSLRALRKDFPHIPIIGTVPAIKIASNLTENRKIGILGTRLTTKSIYLSKLIIKHANHHRVIVHGTDKLVPFIELGEINNARFEKLLKEDLSLFIKEDIDSLVLSCTHFNFLRDHIYKIHKFKFIIDSSIGVAKRTEEILVKKKLLGSPHAKPIHKFYTSDVAKKFDSTLKSLLEKGFLSKIYSVERIDL